MSRSNRRSFLYFQPTPSSKPPIRTFYLTFTLILARSRKLMSQSIISSSFSFGPSKSTCFRSFSLLFPLIMSRSRSLCICFLLVFSFHTINFWVLMRIFRIISSRPRTFRILIQSRPLKRPKNRPSFFFKM